MGLVKRASSLCNTSYSSYINDAHGFRRNVPDAISTSPSCTLLSEKENIPEEPDEHHDEEEVSFRADQATERNVPEGSVIGGKACEFESTDDWYASVSDMEEDSDNALAKPYGYNAVNPVLECVNQVNLIYTIDSSTHY